MAEIHGKGGGVTYSTASTTVNNWTLSYVADALEVTNFDNSTDGRNYIGGLTGWSGSYDCFFATGNVDIPGSTGSITLTISTGANAHAWSGDIIVTGMDITTSVDGVITQTYTFQGNGALTTA